MGCGTGVLLAEMARSAPGLELVGLDLSLAMLTRVRARVPGRVRFAHHRTLSTTELERLLGGAGFELVRLDRYGISGLWGMMTGVARAAPRLLTPPPSRAGAA